MSALALRLKVALLSSAVRSTLRFLAMVSTRLLFFGVLRQKKDLAIHFLFEYPEDQDQEDAISCVPSLGKHQQRHQGGRHTITSTKLLGDLLLTLEIEGKLSYADTAKMSAKPIDHFSDEDEEKPLRISVSDHIDRMDYSVAHGDFISRVEKKMSEVHAAMSPGGKSKPSPPEIVNRFRGHGWRQSRSISVVIGTVHQGKANPGETCLHLPTGTEYLILAVTPFHFPILEMLYASRGRGEHVLVFVK
ncbi:unnamed protein product [Amoebophrya sp. A25]|nr:unnamed protein product [Amoebophrya sp. A25]|eukprot:GSA25T00018901001.1